MFFSQGGGWVFLGGLLLFGSKPPPRSSASPPPFRGYGKCVQAPQQGFLLRGKRRAFFKCLLRVPPEVQKNCRPAKKKRIPTTSLLDLKTLVYPPKPQQQDGNCQAHNDFEGIRMML